MSVVSRHTNYKNVFVVDHPLVQHHLTFLRNKNTDMQDFRYHLRQVAILMACPLLSQLSTEKQVIETPLQTIESSVLSGKSPVLVPILRAALVMAEEIAHLIPHAPIGHIGVYRDHDTARPVEYLVRLPDVKDRQVFIIDPMLATGYSILHVLSLLESKGADLSRLSIMCLIAAPEGIDNVLSHYPDMPIYTASVDECLNEKSYILPGLGDAGDRMFGTT